MGEFEFDNLFYDDVYNKIPLIAGTYDNKYFIGPFRWVSFLTVFISKM
jgi:hypothetical protein